MVQCLSNKLTLTCRRCCPSFNPRRNGNGRPLRRALLTRCEKAFDLTPPPGEELPQCDASLATRTLLQACGGMRAIAGDRWTCVCGWVCATPQHDEAPIPALVAAGSPARPLARPSPPAAGMSAAHRAKLGAVGFVTSLFRAGVVPAAVIKGCLAELLERVRPVYVTVLIVFR